MHKYELQLKATHAAVAARNPTVSLPTLPPFRTIYTIAQMDEIVQYQRTITKLNLKSYNNVGQQPLVQATKAMHQEESTSSPIQGSIIPTETTNNDVEQSRSSRRGRPPLITNRRNALEQIPHTPLKDNVDEK